MRRFLIALVVVAIGSSLWLFVHEEPPIPKPSQEPGKQTQTHRPLPPTAPINRVKNSDPAPSSGKTGSSSPPAAQDPSSTAGQTRVFGRVVDQSGNGVPKVALRIQSTTIAARSKTDGSFEFPTRLPPGPARIIIDSKGWSFQPFDPRATHSIEVPPTKTSLEVRLGVHPVPSITGRILTTDGQPAVGYHIKHNPPLKGFRARGIADANGEFALFAPTPPGDGPVELVPEHCANFGLPVSRTLTRWGAQNVVVTVRRATRINLKVEHQSNGEPVGAYELFVCSLHHPGLVGQLLNEPYRTVTSSDGVDQLFLLPGPHRLCVFPKVRGLMPKIAQLQVEEEGPPLDVVVRLKSAPTLEVTVTGQAGQAVGRAEVVAAVVSTRTEIAGNARLPSWRNTETIPVPELAETGVVDQGRTDDRGVAVLTVHPPSDLHLRLSVTAPGYLARTQFVNLADWRKGKVACPLQKAPLVSLKLEPASISQFKPHVRLHAAGSRTGWLRAEPGQSVLEVPALAPGVYSVDLTFAPFAGIDIHVNASSVTIAGGTQLLKVDLSSFVPVALRGTAFLDGMPAKQVRLHMRSDGQVQRGWIGTALVSKNGEFSFPLVPRGNFGLSIPKGPIPIVAKWDGRVSGESDVRYSIDLRTRQAQLVIAERSGAVLVEKLVWVSYREHPKMIYQLKTDRLGRLQIDAVAADSLLRVAGVLAPFGGLLGTESSVGSPRVVLK